MRLRDVAVWWLLFCLTLSCPLSAAADATDRAHMSDIAGSERLRLFAYGKLLETGNAPRSAVLQMKQDMVRQGYYYDPGTRRVIATNAWVAPVLSYDGNINGGVVQDSFVFGGQVFDADPGFIAKAGVVMGLATGAQARIAWDNGRFFELGVRGEAVWSPRYDIGRSNEELNLCSRNHVTGWTFFDLCQTASAYSRQLGSSTSQTSDAALSQLFTAGGSDHELIADLSRTSYDIGSQTAMTVTWNAVWNRAATNIALTLATPIQGQTVMRRRIEAGVNWLWQGHSVGLNLWQQQSDGGIFLLSPRADSSVGISLSYDIRPGLTAQIGYMVNRSTVEFFTYDQLSLNVRFDALRW